MSSILATRTAPDPVLLASAFHTFLAEKALTAEVLEQPVPSVVDFSPSAGIQPALRLVSLADVSHVNALAPGQEIKFHPTLTILFGENAAGKSGYCRILKRLANVRSAEDILDNVDGSSSGSPTATIKYALGNEEHTVKWEGKGGVPPFGRLAAFDSRAVGLHVDDDLNYQYTPGDLVLFPLCHAAVDAVRELLEALMTERRLELPLSSNVFTRGTPVFVLFESLGAATDLDRLRMLGTLDDGTEARLQQLRTSFASLRTETSIRPLPGVNFTAFVSKFQKIC